HRVQVLIDRVRRSCVPLAVCGLFTGRQDRYPSAVSVQIPRDTDPDMRVQTQRLILSQHAYSGDSRIATVTQREINDPILAAKCDGRLDRKSTRLNSSHVSISYAVFCLKKKN